MNMTNRASAIAPSRALNYLGSTITASAPRRRKRATVSHPELICPFEISTPSRASQHPPPLELKCDAPDGAAIVENLRLVNTIASSIRKSLPVQVDFDDLVHAGLLGLVAAARKYDSERQTSFPTYAKHRIRGAILDSLRSLDWASRDVRRRQKLVAAAMNELTAIL